RAQSCALSLHDALPIFELVRLPDETAVEVAEVIYPHVYERREAQQREAERELAAREAAAAADSTSPGGTDAAGARAREPGALPEDRKSTRLNSSHVKIS